MNKKIGPLKVWQLAAIGAVVGLYLLYRYHVNNSTANQNATVGATDTSGLIDPTTGLPFAQEGIASGSAASDTSGAMAPSGLDSLAQSLMDLQGINEELQAFGFPGIAPATGSSAGSASGSSGASQVTSTTGGGGGGATAGSVHTHKGGPFYKWYVKVTGHAPPAIVSVDNPLYALWKAGAPANRVVRPGGTQNPGHTSTTHTGGSGNRNRKSTSSNSHGSSHANHSAKPVAPPNHQRQTSGVTGGAGLPGPNTPSSHPPSTANTTAPKGGTRTFSSSVPKRVHTNPKPKVKGKSK